ncbi:MAG: ATP-dependent DNA helicase RecG, partial [Microgenomates group bacterium GW2011_GWA1_46_7]
LLDFATTIRSIHFPSSKSDLENAIHRLAFDELFALQKEALKNRELAQVPTLPLSLNQPELADFIASLPFTPTAAQSRVIQEITADLSQPLAMHRLLSGEVGSGKTLVAAYSALLTHYSSRRTLLMAPTQILAEQLFANFSSLLGSRCTFSLLTSVSKGDVDADIVIGTHALLKQISNFHNIGLVIIDEQHRFGVDQRLLLTKLNPAPHFLMMTATPIPRTLAMTVFSHLSLSRLDELPQNRLPVKTYHVTEDKRVAAYDWIRQEVLTHQNQAFVVVPLIDQAEDDETSATQSLKKLEKDLSARFPDLVVDIMHGRMKGSEKTAHLQAFRDGHTQILVATSMIEVGLDIPEANIMVIENADRFGLATLHQLRGRVGRGGKQGHCLLFAHQPSEKALARLAYFVREKDGAKLAEFDLASRGPGELYGTTQHGFFSLRFASIYDQALLRQTAEAVKMLSI